jgi:hypothetical protein
VAEPLKTPAEEALRQATVETPSSRPLAPLGTTTSRSERARREGYRTRFVLVYFVLAIVAGAAAGGFLVAIRSSKPAKPPVQVKQFVPAASGELGAIEIADHVARTYRLASGAELVDVVATRNTLQDSNLGLLRVSVQIIQPFDGLRNADSRILLPTNAIQYSLCGTESNCAIAGGPSYARGVLLRREGLELAARTLTALPTVDNVVVFMRPVPAPQGSSYEGFALMFSRSAIAHDDPGFLREVAALPGSGTRLTPASMTSSAIQKVVALARPYLFLYRYQVIGGHDAALELQPYPS